MTQEWLERVRAKAQTILDSPGLAKATPPTNKHIVQAGLLQLMVLSSQLSANLRDGWSIADRLPELGAIVKTVYTGCIEFMED